MQEVWKSVNNFEGLYEVSSYGRIRGCDRLVKHSCGNSMKLWSGRVLKQTVAATRGYCMVTLSKDGISYKVYTHRLVAETFIDCRNETVNHKDGNKLNNNVENLEWISYSDNNRHAFQTGLKVNPKGKRK